MGACASCLGRDRSHSRDIDQTDPLLDHSQAGYGGTEAGDLTQPDEEELRVERESLERITGEATDNMIDIMRPGASELSQGFAYITGTQKSGFSDDSAAKTASSAEEEAEEDEDEEAAWLQAVQSAGADKVAVIKGLSSGDLVLDIGQLRDGPPPSAAKRSMKARLAG